MNKLIFIFIALTLFSCTNDDVDEIIPNNEMYFPSLTENTWQIQTPNSLQWNENKIQSLLDYLELKNTKGFIILKDGKIVIEKYFNGHSQTSNWYWASAGKTLTGFLVGIAEQENFLSIDDKTSNYLGEHWTALSLEKEDLISIKHQLTMTTGLDDTDFENTTPEHLTYLEDAGNRWAYHNSPYTLLDNVIANATNQSFSAYFDAKIKNKIGMNGAWYSVGFNNVYYSNTRSMARFGLLLLNNAKWQDTQLLNENYFQTMVNTSQDYNNSYGYLTWLNGKSSFMLPSIQQVFSGSIIPNAPDDMFMALGKNDQKIYVVPSKKLVVIRMGENAGENAYTLSSFDNTLWEKINLVINN